MSNIKKKLILVVDDESDLREIMADEMAMVEAKVIEAPNGTIGFEKFLNEKPDAVVSDLNMPGGNGATFLDHIKAKSVSTPVIMLISDGDFSDEEAFLRGADGIFTKPFELTELVKTIDQLLTPVENRWASSNRDLSLEVKLKIEFADIAKSIELNELKFGRGGFCVKVGHKEIKNKDLVEFQFINPKTRSKLSGFGICRWHKGHSNEKYMVVGVEFAELLGDPAAFLQTLDSANGIPFIPKISTGL